MATQTLLSPNPTTNELSGSVTVASLPSLYASQDPETKLLEPVIEEEIPVIDFSLLTGGSLDQRSQTVRDLGRACEDWGFFMLVNHGVPESLREGMMGAIKGFFDLTVEEKGEYADTHVMNPIRHGTSFNTAVDDVRYWRDYLKVITHPVFSSPTKPPCFSEILREYSTCTRELAKELLKGILDSLGVDDSYMKEALHMDSCWQVVVGNQYPLCPHPELAVGLPSHSDYGLLTMLYQNGVKGLEVKHNDKWVRVQPLSDAFLVNIGDHIEIVSNGRYKSVLHRASVNDTKERMSVLSLIGTSMDTVVVPAPQLVSDENHPTVFRGMKFSEYVEIQQSSRLREKSILDLLRLQTE